MASSSSKTLMFLTIFSLTSWISTAFIPGLEAQLGDMDAQLGGLGAQLGDMGAISGSMQCMKKLLPCQEYLHSPMQPPSSCCVPLSEMLKDEPDCLCDVFNNPILLKTLNVTVDEALKLPTACGAKADISVCSEGAASPISSASAPPAPVPSAPTKGSESSIKKSSANGLTQVGGYTLVVIFMSMIISMSF